MSLLKEELELKAAEAEFIAEETLQGFPTWQRYALYIMAAALVPGYLITKNIAYHSWQSQYKAKLVVAKEVVTEALPLKTGKVMIMQNGNGSQAAYVDITNQNLDLSARNVQVNVVFYGKNNEPLYTEKESFEFLPNQTKHFVIPRITTPGTITSANIELPEKIKWQRKTDIPNITISKSIPVLTNPVDQNILTAEGRITNRNQYLIKKVRLQFFVYNTQNQVIAVTQRDEFDVDSNTPRAYKVFWPNINKNNVSKVDVVIDTNLLDSENLKPLATQNTPASDLSRPDNNK